MRPPAPCPLPHDLARGLGEPVPAAQAGEVELVHGVCPVDNVGHCHAKARAEPVASDPVQHVSHILGAGQALLDRHDDRQDCLPLRHGPQSRLDGGNGWSCPRDADLGVVAGAPAAGLVDPYPIRSGHPRGLGQPHVDEVLVEPGQAVGHEGGDASERRRPADLGECGPPSRRGGPSGASHDDSAMG